MALQERQNLPTPDNYGPVVGASAWCLLTLTVLAVLVRMATKLSISRSVGPDDALILVGLLASVGQTAATILQVDNGLGQPLASLDSAKILRFQQSGYAAELLFVVNLFFTKASIILLLRNLTPNKLHRLLSVILGISILLWATSGFLAVAFQGHLPHPWMTIDGSRINHVLLDGFRSHQYFDRGMPGIATFSYYLADSGASIQEKYHLELFRTQIAVSNPYIYIPLSKLHTGPLTALSVVAAIIAQLVFLAQDSGAQDVSFSRWREVLSAELVQNLGIVTACIPYLKPFFESLQSGMMRNDDLKRRCLTSDYGYPSAKSINAPSSKHSRITLKIRGPWTEARRQQEHIELGSVSESPDLQLPFDGPTRFRTDTRVGADAKTVWDADRESQESSSRIIK
ncbi:MAG: hypothetical protein M1830_001642 [Pleopsidium flavum]|nr:MAG: hypothetical protein M1830_001642 [Pleopsidium flavum]